MVATSSQRAMCHRSQAIEFCPSMGTRRRSSSVSPRSSRSWIRSGGSSLPEWTWMCCALNNSRQSMRSARFLCGPGHERTSSARPASVCGRICWVVPAIVCRRGSDLRRDSAAWAGRQSHFLVRPQGSRTAMGSGSAAPGMDSGSAHPGRSGHHRGLGPIPGADLLQDVADVRLGGPVADEELGRDLVVGASGGDQPEHLALAGSEAGDSRGSARGRPRTGHGE